IVPLTSRERASCSPLHPPRKSPDRLSPLQPTSIACRRVHVPAAVAAWSSLRLSRTAVSKNTAPHPRRNRSVSIPHDAVTTYQRPQWQASFSLVCYQQCSRSRCCTRVDAARCANPLTSHAATDRSLASLPKTVTRSVTAAAPRNPSPLSRRG